MNAINGKKTYIVGALGILGTIGGIIGGSIDQATGIQTILGLVMGMTIRHGISTGA